MARRTSLLAFLLGLAALLASPSALAQAGPSGLSVEVRAPPPWSPPETATPVVVAVTATCEALLAHADPAAPAQADVSIEWTEAPPSVVVTGNHVVHIPVADCVGSTSVTAEEPFDLVLSREAPGLKTMTLGVGVHWAQPPFEDDVVIGAVSVSADYVPGTELSVADAVLRCSCPRLAFEVDLRNVGNARTQYNFEVVEAPEGDWDIMMPDPVILDSPFAGGLGTTSERVTISILLDEGSVGKGAYVLRVLPASADQPDKKAEPIEFSLLAEREGLLSDVPIPAPASPLLVVGLLAVALLARRRA